MRTLKTALVQMKVCEDLTKNLLNASKLIGKAKENGAKLIALPECFNSPYGTKHFPKYAETVGSGPTSELLSKSAKENSIYLVGGTFPEIDNGKFYNTCTVWNPEGKMIAKFRKMHLFDIDIPGKITFKESEILSGGNRLECFDVDEWKIGLGICYDLRFEELAKLYRLQGCHMLIYPAAFNMTTGPLHYELLQRSRAVDNQVFVLGISPARNEDGYVAWGYSQVTNPWGKVIAQAGYDEEIIYCDCNMKECDDVRSQIPVFYQRRKDVYDTLQL